MSTPTITTAPAARRAAVALAAVREQWGDLLAAIERPPAAEWPPRETRGFLGQAAAQGEDAIPATAVIGRMPLVLREHPAPLNLDALDAAMMIERELFDLADQVAEQTQRPVRTWIGLRGSITQDVENRDDPARWHYQAATSPGSRAYGLHWAAVWLEGRALGEPAGDLFRPVPVLLAEHIASVAARARRTLERALGRDQRTTTLDHPCPWCRGPLTGQTTAGNVPEIHCGRGEECPAPVVLDNRRRVWRGADLVDLWVGLTAAKRRAEEQGK
ncbi:hypothetical protein [Streptomyces sp. NBC_00199]|uniref:hypothetical protein n=1 Tax=Streptomyces sp. NBC_00199 TaxID=2975678 RepID=UPI002250AEA3|nr:hypothetical protein [Streptomyces sp. NBC_00199]MCX5266069.1 hypothetical protein [Streptomyces sp. NBC_00199]